MFLLCLSQSLDNLLKSDFILESANCGVQLSFHFIGEKLQKKLSLSQWLDSSVYIIYSFKSLFHKIILFLPKSSNSPSAVLNHYHMLSCGYVDQVLGLCT